MNPKVSIIMPVYNTQKYLREMLDSIINQKFTEFELITVNDGSTDESLSILYEYAKKDNRIIVIDKPNSGVSDTRNQGLERALGEYICFVDADDVLSPYYLKILYEIADAKNADMVVGNYQTFHTNPVFPKVEIEIKQNTGSKELIDLGLLTTPCAKIIRLSVLKKYNIKFPTGVTFGEDLFFCWNTHMVCENIWLTNQKIYGYRLSGNSTIYNYHSNVYENYKLGFECLKKTAMKNNKILEIQQIDFFFTKRIPTFMMMIAREKTSVKRKIQGVNKVLDDITIQTVLSEHWDIFKKTLTTKEISIYRNVKEKNAKMCLLFGYKRDIRMKLGALISKFGG